MSAFKKLCKRANKVLDQVEQLLPTKPEKPDWDNAIAFRWRKRDGERGYIESVHLADHITFDALKGIDTQKQRVDQNTLQFVQGYSANNVLLTGARGSGKSSLVKALLNKYAKKGLRLIEVDKQHLVDLHDIVEQIYKRPERFILYCDDLSFEVNEPGYKALKVVLDGSIATVSDNVLIYATSNRRHMIPEFMDENLTTKHIDGEIHPGETIEEKVSLSERFGLWVSFYPFGQEQYLEIVQYWLQHLGVKDFRVITRTAALQWALERGSRSGRVAWQFARDWAGQHHAAKK